MRVFEWDSINIEHIAAHHVTVKEAEEALSIAPLEIDFYKVEGEERFEDVGQTASGRILRIVSVAFENRVRVVTAFDASALSRRIYLRSIISQ